MLGQITLLIKLIVNSRKEILPEFSLLGILAQVNNVLSAYKKCQTSILWRGQDFRHHRIQYTTVDLLQYLQVQTNYHRTFFSVKFVDHAMSAYIVMGLQ